MKYITDRTGQRFGRLTVLHRGPNKCVRHTAWECRCDCGAITIVSTMHLVTGHTKSCGCLRSELHFQRYVTHGATIGCAFDRSAIPAEYRIWCSAKGRCFNPRTRNFASYGGRGIGMCDRWRHSFANFLSDMGPRPTSQHSLDRFPNNDGNYEPGNCRWATRAEQGENTRANIRVTISGETMVLKAAARKFDVSYVALYKAVALRNEAPLLAIQRLHTKGSRFHASPVLVPS